MYKNLITQRILSLTSQMKFDGDETYFKNIESALKDALNKLEEKRQQKNKNEQIQAAPNNADVNEMELLEDLVSMTEWMNDWCQKLPANLLNASNRVLAVKKLFIENRYKIMHNMFEILGGWKSSSKLRNLMLDVEIMYYDALEIIAANTKDPLTKQLLGKIHDYDYASSEGLHENNKPELRENVIDCEKLTDKENVIPLMTALNSDVKKQNRTLKTTDKDCGSAIEVLQKNSTPIESKSEPNIEYLLETTNLCIDSLKGVDLQLSEAMNKLDINDHEIEPENAAKETKKDIEIKKDIMCLKEPLTQALEIIPSKKGDKNNLKTNNANTLSPIKVIAAVSSFLVLANFVYFILNICNVY